jgi:hypothetical protein
VGIGCAFYFSSLRALQEAAIDVSLLKTPALLYAA